MTNYVQKINEAKVYDVAVKTPLDAMPKISRKLNADVLMKREDQQPVFSFKLRGAYNKIAHLTKEELIRGVICASAGNHAQGVALSAKKLGIKAVIVMPVTTPEIKVEAVKYFGGENAEVVLSGDTYDEAFAHAKKLEKEKGYTFIHPFDDPEVIAGQGTIGKEILEQAEGKKIEAVFIAIGGGGLAAGVASYIKAMRPDIKIIGVESIESACMKAAIEQNKRVILDKVGIFADGIAVRQAGEETFKLCKDLLDEVVTVTTDEICAAIKDIFEDTRIMCEPAGAVSLAAIKNYVAQNPERKGALVGIICGANLNFDRLRHIAERAEIGEAREILLGVTIPEKPGSYRKFIQVLGNRNISEFNYRYAEGKDAHVFVGIKLKDAKKEKAAIFKQLNDLGYNTIDISDNETAKIHLRYMVGGRLNANIEEMLLRFEFPEKPGALMKFLDSVGEDWNITLFHYRNHGSDYGRVLVGVEVPKADREEFTDCLNQLGYAYEDESQNPAYRMFLK